MSLEANKAIVRRFIDAYNNVVGAYNKQNLDVFDELFAPDYVDHTHQLGPEGVKQLFNMAANAFPDWHETIEDIIAEGEKVWVRVKATGTITGEYRGLAPTGKKVTYEAVDIYRIVNGKLVEYWGVSDSDFLKQLGVIEYTEKGKQLFPEDAE
jgi:predicted ester cyclase